jgi:UvrB/uvrC motif.
MSWTKRAPGAHQLYDSAAGCERDRENIETIRAEKEAAIKAQDYEKAAALRDSEQHTKDKLERILKVAGTAR